MSRKNTVWIGADPGGEGNFGLAILDSKGVAQFRCVDCADEAICIVRKELKSTPGGVGVDAPLWWSSGRSSDRQADQWLRREYKLSGGEVQAANSMRGAALVQGAMFVSRMRECFPDVGVTETHPKALLKALKMENGNAFFRKFAITLKTKIDPDRLHERDAIISAVAAREGFEKRWRTDLSANRSESEQDPSKYWLSPVNYFWPE